MKKLTLLLLFISKISFGANVPISALPLGVATATGSGDSFPYVQVSPDLTKRLTLWDIANLPTLTAMYATKASPTFTGTMTAAAGNFSGTFTANLFVGPLTGNASTATALAANPTDCSSGQFANAIAANGNLTCAAVSGTVISGIVPAANGGTGFDGSAAGNGKLPVGNGTGFSLANITGTANQVVVTNGSGTIVLSGPQDLATSSSPSFSKVTSTVSTGTAPFTVTSTTRVSNLNVDAAGNSDTVTTNANMTGDVTSSGNATTLATVNSNVGSFTSANITVNGKGLITAASNGTPVITYYPVTIQSFTSGSGTYNLDYTFIITSGSATVGATYTNNSVTFTVYATVSSATAVVMSGSGAPTSSGTLTKSGGTGDSTLTFSAFKKPIYLHAKAVGAGGGGGGSGSAAGSAGGTGGNTTFGSSLITANGGVGGATWATAVGGAGGSATIGSGALGISLAGTSGFYGTIQGGGYSINYDTVGGAGANSAFGGGALGNAAVAGNAGVTNTGGGGAGGGAANNAAAPAAGGGGGAGGFVDAFISAPSATYSYAVGAAGTSGTAGTNGRAGGAGGSGLLLIEEYYQ